MHSFYFSNEGQEFKRSRQNTLKVDNLNLSSPSSGNEPPPLPPPNNSFLINNISVRNKHRSEMNNHSELFGKVCQKITLPKTPIAALKKITFQSTLRSTQSRPSCSGFNEDDIPESYMSFQTEDRSRIIKDNLISPSDLKNNFVKDTRPSIGKIIRKESFTKLLGYNANTLPNISIRDKCLKTGTTVYYPDTLQKKTKSVPGTPPNYKGNSDTKDIHSNSSESDLGKLNNQRLPIRLNQLSYSANNI